MDKSIFLKNNIAIESSIDLEHISQPLKKTGIELFGYHRLYNDGTEIMLCNDAIWTAYYYNNKFTIENGVLEKVGLDKFEYIIWPTEWPKCSMRKAKEISHISHLMSLKLNSENYCEFFGFATKLNSIYCRNSINIFLNNIDVFKKFCLHFKKVASHILKICESNRIIPVNADYLSQNRLKNIRNKNYYTLGNTIFSDRELDCIKYLLMGKTMREISEKLFISPRTVETHLENIKNKLGCNKKSEAISKLLEIDSIRLTLSPNII
jgi:LuxR family quorum-sensing system transcriptional regulator SolR